MRSESVLSSCQPYRRGKPRRNYCIQVCPLQHSSSNLSRNGYRIYLVGRLCYQLPQSSFFELQLLHFVARKTELPALVFLLKSTLYSPHLPFCSNLPVIFAPFV